MDNPFANMTEEQLLALIRKADLGDKDPEPEKPASVKVTLADGSSIEAANHEDLNRALQARLEDAIRSGRAPEPARQPQSTPAQPTWDMKTFTDRFVVDPDDGLDYLEQAKYGMSVRKAVPQMLAITAALAQKVQDLEASSYAPKGDAERTAVERVMRERNWQPSRQAFQDALDIAKARGLVSGAEEVTAPATRPFIPPRVPRASEDPSSNEAEIIRTAETMDLGKLEDILLAQGIIKSRRT